MMPSTPRRAPSPRSDFQRRLGYFLIGLAIGCVMVGMLFSMRAKLIKAGGPTPPQAATGPAASPQQRP